MRHTRRPNIVLIMTDQQRRDTLGCYGADLAPTPALDRLAGEGAVFDHFYVNNPVCVPSRCSFLTGRYPGAHRSRDLRVSLDPQEAHLFGVLQDAGYRTGLCGKNHALGKGALARFDLVYERGHAKTRLPVHSVYGSAADPMPLEAYPTRLVCEAGTRFLADAAAGAAPFCLWLSFPDPHTPFQVPEPYASLVDRRRIPAPVEPVLGPTKPLSQRLVCELQGLREAGEGDIRQLRAIYHGMVALLDEAVGDILQALDRLGLAEETIVVFTSDHGEYLGDHGMVRKSWHFYDCLLRVPFLIRWPGRLAPRRVADTLAESVDLLPTLLDLVGLPAPPAVQGRSLRPLLDGETATHKDVVYAEAGNPGESPGVRSVAEWRSRPEQAGPLWSIGAVQGCMVRTREWKLCQYVDGEGELYDLQADPHETANRFGEPSHAAAQLALGQLLAATMLRAQDPRPSGGDRFRGE